MHQTTSASRALLIVNERSRTGSESLDAAAQGMRENGFFPVHKRSTSRDHLSELIEQYGPEHDLIVIGGGDGTISAAAAGIRKIGKPLGILPLGTANDLARTLAIPLDLQEAIRVIASGHTRDIDLGSVNGHLFFNVASIGLSAELAKELTPQLKRRFGKIGYAIAALRVLSRARPFRCRIEREDGTSSHSFSLQVAVGNGKYYGGGNVVESTADIDDGQLDLYSLEFLNAWKLALLLPSFRIGKHGSHPEVKKLKGTRFVVSTRRQKSVNTDGELACQTPAEFTVIPKAIRVFMPREPSAQ